MKGKEAVVILATLSQVMAEKMDEPILHVNSQIKIMFARSYSRVFLGSLSPSPFLTQEPDWVSGEGLCLV